MNYSHTRLSCFEQCPRKFWYAYVAKVPTEGAETVEAFLGTQVHDALESLYTKLLNGRLLTREQLLAFYDQGWKKEWNDEIIIVSKEYRKVDYYRVGRAALAKYYDRHQPFDQDQTLALETMIRIDLDGTGRYKMVGYIDRLAQQANGTYEVHDYKTARRLPTQPEMDEDRQLALYHIGVAGMWPGVERVQLIWHYVRFDKEIRSSRTPEQLQAVKDQCIHLIDDIESRGRAEAKFPTRTSRLCQWCEFAGVCPEMKHPVAVQAMPAKERKADAGVKLVDQLVTLDTKRLKLRERLAEVEQSQQELLDQIIALAHEQGLSCVSGRTYRVELRTTTELDYPKADDERREQFETTLRKVGLWDQLLMLSTQRFKSLWHDLPKNVKKAMRSFVTEREVIQAKLRRGGNVQE